MTKLEFLESHPSYVDATNPTDQVLFDWSIEMVTQNKTSLSGDVLFNTADVTEQNALTDAQKSQWLALCGRDSIDPFGAANVALVTQLFGGGSATITALNALRTEQVPRYQDAGVGYLRIGEIAMIRGTA
jgi:hypothetical protein